MRILHLYLPRIPATRAQSIQILGTCHALAAAGCRVTLLARAGSPDATPASALAAHGLEPVDGLDLKLVRTENPAAAGWWFRGQVLRWAAGARGDSVVYARAKRYADQLMRLPGRPPIAVEAHELDSAQAAERGADPTRWLALERRVLAEAGALVTNCEGTLGCIEEAHGPILPAVRRAVHNATHASRARTWDPDPDPVIGYAGSLRSYKGQATLLAAADSLPPGARIELLGGSDREREALGSLPEAIRLRGEVPYLAVPDVIARWRAALLPLDADLFGSRLCNPLKLWDYLAVGLPLVAADLPTLREVLGPDEACWYTPGDPASLSAAIRRALTPGAPTPRRLRTWGDRAREILPILEGMLSR